MYESEGKTHVVVRRFSDFEYLLKQLTEKPEYKSYVFPTLPEKRIVGNLEAAFVEKRRVELEGVLRVLIQSDNRIKNDMNINAFLTFEEAKYKEFRQNPSPFLDAMWGVYNSLPSQKSIKQVQRQGVANTVKHVFKRVKQEIKGIKEPKVLQEEADFMDFDSVEKVLEKNLTLFEEAQSAQEVYHTTFHN